MYTELFKEAASFAGAPIAPISNASSQYTGTVDMSKFHRVVFVGQAGVVGANATVDAFLQQGNLANGSDAANISGAAITQVTASGRLFTIETYGPMLTGRYVRGGITVGVNASLVSGTIFGFEARNHPANSNDWNSSLVQRIVPAVS